MLVELIEFALQNLNAPCKIVQVGEEIIVFSYTAFSAKMPFTGRTALHRIRRNEWIQDLGWFWRMSVQMPGKGVWTILFV
jgi:hypothetical protein